MSDRGKGRPKTEEERRKRHGITYPGEKLPPRGTGLQRGSAAGSKGRDRLVDLLVSILLLAFVVLIRSLFSSRKRKEDDS
ncbi:hypothetical protein [[Eubacterium] cellulosolvens]